MRIVRGVPGSEAAYARRFSAPDHILRAVARYDRRAFVRLNRAAVRLPDKSFEPRYELWRWTRGLVVPSSPARVPPEEMCARATFCYAIETPSGERKPLDWRLLRAMYFGDMFRRLNVDQERFKKAFTAALLRQGQLDDDAKERAWMQAVEDLSDEDERIHAAAAGHSRPIFVMG
jgi:hypothetical protein